MLTERTIMLERVLKGAVLVVNHGSNVRYANRVRSEPVMFQSMEGILVPLPLEEHVIMRLRNYDHSTSKTQVSDGFLDLLDDVLAADSRTQFIRCDRPRRELSLSNWIHVEVNSPPSTVIGSYKSYFGRIYGFGTTTGVVTWGMLR